MYSSSTKHLTTGRHAMIASCPRDIPAAGHANGIVAPLWKLRGRARSQFAACQLYLRIGSVDGTRARDRETCSSSRGSSASQSWVSGSFRSTKGKINDSLTNRCLFDFLMVCATSGGRFIIGSVLNFWNRRNWMSTYFCLKCKNGMEMCSVCRRWKTVRGRRFLELRRKVILLSDY